MSDVTNPNDPSTPATGSTLSCREVEALVSGIIDGELDRQTRHAAELHLLDCAVCREMINRAEALDGLVAAAGEREGPSELPERVRLGVLGAIAREQARSMRLPLLAWSGWAAAAALALFVTVGSIAGWFGPAGPGRTSPETRLLLASHEREALTFVRVLARALSGELSEAEYERLLASLRDVQAEMGEPLVSRLLGSEGRAALRDLAQRTDLTDAQRQVVELAERLVADLESGRPIDRGSWQRLDTALRLLPLS